MSLFPSSARSPHPNTVEELEDSFRCAILENVGKSVWQDLKEAPLDWLTSMYPEMRALGFNGHHIVQVLKEMKDTSTPQNQRLLAKIESYTNIMQPWMTLPAETRDFVYGIGNGYSFMWPEEYITKNPEFKNDLTSHTIVKATLRALQFRHLIGDPNYAFTQQNYDGLTRFVRTFWGNIHPDDENFLDVHKDANDYL